MARKFSNNENPECEERSNELNFASLEGWELVPKKQDQCLNLYRVVQSVAQRDEDWESLQKLREFLKGQDKEEIRAYFQHERDEVIRKYQLLDKLALEKCSIERKQHYDNYQARVALINQAEKEYFKAKEEKLQIYKLMLEWFLYL
ncbi:hypothetical protein FGO68_gene15972 [Halteria grandinella]|uniref:Uncharacterized protein n=1 Tax=Halteria grandinella TaxID=5974 RepID=A0A8J8NM15_HALGN|nr:hypothetical protein FGO68_gene15972 [Halteria grandinella]